MASPELYRKWAAISLCAAALERRVWASTSLGDAFANLYVLLVGNPGIGKFVIETAREIAGGATDGGKKPALAVAPDNMSKAALMDTMAASGKIWLPRAGGTYAFHSLYIVQEEFEVLLPAYDKEYIGSLNSIFNNKPLHEERRRHGPVKELRIERPQLNILGGAQPSYFVSTFPEEAWNTGFARRLIMVYAHETPFRELFAEAFQPGEAKTDLANRLVALSALFGQMKWEQGAGARLADWHRAGGPPRPGHSKLTHYCNTRTLFAEKLAMASSASRGPSMVIELRDVTRGIEWLLEAEAVMPDIFREMAGKSDTQVIEELYLYVTAQYNKSKHTPLREELIVAFLAQRLPAERVQRVMEIAERSGSIARVAGTSDQYVPKLRELRGME